MKQLFIIAFLSLSGCAVYQDYIFPIFSNMTYDEYNEWCEQYPRDCTVGVANICRYTGGLDDPCPKEDR